MLSLNIKLTQQDQIINYEQDELMMSKSKTHELAKEIDRLLYEKSVEDDPVVPLSVFVCKCVSLCTVLYFDLQ